ncbi:clostripain-related cysteine peptidase [Candidatus Viridilinea mediisalina]|uniref:Peptidase C11 clostripain n=1 Tax=Candidatus Viridilinea mediisalina TaxID=2024553 RepID=A0A2A6RGE4_9CHLR|nr:clostripain-related cysteine peptidase [Candidatus Viridilinea mediisalina]PDW02137.1 hypothetical protein CJ255_15605 [Candidatus Viridilinea mediisalina]
MLRIIRSLTTVLLLCLFLVNLTAMPEPTVAQSGEDCTLDVLPRPGTGTLPPSTMSISGYVILNRQPMIEASIIATAENGTSMALNLVHSPSSCAPFYEIPLGQAPLRLQAGQSVSFQVTVSGFTTTIQQRIPQGGGRLDLSFETTAGCNTEGSLIALHERMNDLYFEANVGQADTTASFLSRTADVVKVNPSGSSRVYSTFIGGEHDDFAWDITVGSDGTAYVVGTSESHDFPVSADAADTICGAPGAPCRTAVRDATLVALQPDGTGLRYGTFLGGEGDEWGHSIALDAAGSVYIAGLTASQHMPGTGPTVAYPHKHRGDDAFVARFDLLGRTARASQVPDADDAWTLLFYLAGDNDLSDHFREQHRRLEAVAGQPGVNILVLRDGAAQGDSMRYYVRPDGNTIEWPMGELNMANPDTLRDFVSWAMENYPARHYYLNIADHGRGTTGIAWDEENNLDEMLTVSELRQALMQATKDGTQPIDVLHLDACLMSMFEVAADASGYADYMVASQNLAWSLFAFDRYADAVRATTTPLQLAQRVTEEYSVGLRAAGVYPYTIAAIDLRRIGAVSQALDELVTALLQHESRATVRAARSATQVFDSRNFYQLDPTDEYVDLADFARQLIARTTHADVRNAAEALVTSITAAVVPETNRFRSDRISTAIGPQFWDLDRSNGIAIYFPPDRDSAELNLYISHGLFWYTQYGSWDDYLRHYFELGTLTTLPRIQPTPAGRPPVGLLRYEVYLPLVRR